MANLKVNPFLIFKDQIDARAELIRTDPEEAAKRPFYWFLQANPTDGPDGVAAVDMHLRCIKVQDIDKIHALSYLGKTNGMKEGTELPVFCVKISKLPPRHKAVIGLLKSVYR